MLHAATLAGDGTLVQDGLDDLTDTERNRGEVREVVAERALAEGDGRGALAALEPTVKETTEVHHGLVLIRSLLFNALAHSLLAEEPEAQASVERALDLAEPDGLIIPFLWVDCRDLLERHPRHHTSHGAFLTMILDALSGRSVERGRPGSPDVDLSETELRVLRFLPTNLTAGEIASEIYVSVNTVKTHMRNIYTKLNAHSRGEAVECARELGLLSRSVRTH